MTLKFNIFARNVGSANAINNGRERIVLRLIFWSFLALSIIYVLILCNMVTNILARRSLEARAGVLSGEVGNLELSYLSMSGNIDLALAHSLGFKETKATFATRKSLSSLPRTSPAAASLPFGNVKKAQNEL